MILPLNFEAIQIFTKTSCHLRSELSLCHQMSQFEEICNNIVILSGIYRFFDLEKKLSIVSHKTDKSPSYNVIPL